MDDISDVESDIEDGGLENNMPEIFNMANDQGGRSSRQMARTVQRLFDKFIQESLQDEEIPVFAEMHPNHLTQDLVGKFASYLKCVKKIKSKNTCLGYISTLRKLFDTDDRFVGVRSAVFEPNWYKRLRTIIEKRYVNECAENGVNLVNHSVPMTESDLIKLCTYLFTRNDPEAARNRCLLVFQWQLIGRINEVAALKFTDISFDEAHCCLNVRLFRSKSSTQQVSMTSNVFELISQCDYRRHLACLCMLMNGLFALFIAWHQC